MISPSTKRINLVVDGKIAAKNNFNIIFGLPYFYERRVSILLPKILN